MMARQRAGQARAAFDRVGTSPFSSVPADSAAIISAGGNDGGLDGEIAGQGDGGNAGVTAVRNDGGTASRSAGTRAGRAAGKKASRPRRRVGRPRGPERIPLTIRILAETDQRLTAAVETTGESPQYLVDKALAAYLDSLGITADP